MTKPTHASQPPTASAPPTTRAPHDTKARDANVDSTDAAGAAATARTSTTAHIGADARIGTTAAGRFSTAARIGAIARWTLAVLACLWIALCVAVGPLYWDDSTIANWSWTNTLYFTLAFIATLAIVALLVSAGSGRLLPAIARMARLARISGLPRPLERPRPSQRTAPAATAAAVADDATEAATDAASGNATGPSRALRAIRTPRAIRTAARTAARTVPVAITRATDRRWKILLILLIGWLWVPTTLLSAFGADIRSQIREFSWAWNQWTGIDQPYIGFFSFVPMDIYPTAHYMWPSDPTYLTDQHNIVLTVIYGAFASVSRYLTDSNDAGFVALSAIQWLFAACCCAATAHRFLNVPWAGSMQTRDGGAIDGRSPDGRSLGRNHRGGNLSLRDCAHSGAPQPSSIPHSASQPSASLRPAGAFARFVILGFFLLCPLVLFSTISLTKSPLFAFAFVWWFGIWYQLHTTWRGTASHATMRRNRRSVADAIRAQRHSQTEAPSDARSKAQSKAQSKALSDSARSASDQPITADNADSGADSGASASKSVAPTVTTKQPAAIDAAPATTAAPAQPSATAPDRAPVALPARTLIAFVAAGCVMLISAKYAWYIIIAQFTLALIADRRRWLTYVTALLLPVIVIHGGISLLIDRGIIINGDPIESRGVQIQQIARVAKRNPGGIPQSARDKLEPIFNLDQMAEAYFPQDADPVKSSGIQSKKVSYKWRSVTADDMRRFNEAWLEIVKANPVIAIDALLAKCFGYFNVTDQPYVAMSYYVNSTYVQEQTEWIKDYNHKWRNDVVKWVRQRSAVPVLGWLMHGNLYVTLTLLIGAAEVVLRRWRTLMTHIPLLLLMGVMITAPANNFERHMLPVAFVFGFVCLTFWRESLRQDMRQDIR
ncbi:DUF6020 family protein [Bifidobacterium jacchi]|uniref:DUF6020 family protein n=1 Tax=Bifidobacterium jacchi TaxID=2490545 RepID=UPI001F4FA855|nr:DUF6020 family protein [Bifidobacterium jacchi]